MRRTDTRRRPQAHPPVGSRDRSESESCYRCRHGRGIIRCACRYARRAVGDAGQGRARARVAYAGRLVAGLILLSGRRFGPGMALFAARGLVPKLAPALAAVPALLKSAWVWLSGFSLATAAALSLGADLPAGPDSAVSAPPPAVCAERAAGGDPRVCAASVPAVADRARRPVSRSRPIPYPAGDASGERGGR